MTNDLISRSGLLKKIRAYADSKVANEGVETANNILKTVQVIEKMPAVDAAPVKRGEWVMSRKYKPWFTCSACEDCYVDGEWVEGHKWSYCPNCGAKMDLEE